MKCDNSLNSNFSVVSHQFKPLSDTKVKTVKEREVRENNNNEIIYKSQKQPQIDDTIEAIRDVGEKIVKMENLEKNDMFGIGAIFVGLSILGLILNQLNKI